ncbi:MAG: hypothetical protein AB7U73_03445 [Pirellulales bacterium]
MPPDVSGDELTRGASRQGDGVQSSEAKSSIVELPLPESHLGPISAAEQQVRELLNRWGTKGFFRLKYMGEKIFIDRIAPGQAYLVELRTHYEDRSLRQAEEPYHGGPVDDYHATPELWDVPVQRAADFEERTERVVVPGTERVELCGGCAGNGRVVCPHCHGQGSRVCPRCQGTGMIEHRTVSASPPGRHDNPMSAPRVIRRRCNCIGGRVRCSSCGGNGVQTCHRCRGSGRTKTFQELVAKFLVVDERQVLDATPVADKALGKLSGDCLLELNEPRVAAHWPITPAVDECVAQELAKSQAVDERQRRVLRQYLRVVRIPQTEVQYTYAGVERQLWICGHEQQVYAPGAPWQRERYWLLVGGIVAAVAAVVGVVAYLLLR